jgi:hypothetical protein
MNFLAIGEYCLLTEGLLMGVENLSIAASLQKVQTLTYPNYAATLNFFCSLHLEFLNSLSNKDFFNTLLRATFHADQVKVIEHEKTSSSAH